MSNNAVLDLVNPTQTLENIVSMVSSTTEGMMKKLNNNKEALTSSSSFHQQNQKEEELFENEKFEILNFPPPLNQVFSATYTFNGSQYYQAQGFVVQGRVAMDFQKSGFMFSVDAISGSMPYDVQAEFRIAPSRHGIDFIGIGGAKDQCYDYIFFQWIFTILLPQYQIPPNSVQGPDQKVNGVDCSVWTFYNGGPQTILFVRKSDNTLMQLSTKFQSIGFSTVTLTNIQSSVNPDIYARPSTCIEILGWNRNWNSHLPWGWCSPFC